jgi:hypothetical protein
MKIKICILVLFMFFLGFDYSGAGNKNSDKPENIIFNLYKEHQPQNGKGISFGDEKTLNRYFTRDLTALLLRNEECVKRTREVCNLNMDPIFDAQDYDKSQLNLEIKEISSKHSSLRYKVTFTNLGRRTVVYELNKTKSGWRISDIIYASRHSLREMLAQPQQ